MSSNYPEGSMMGSGIYSEEITLVVACPNEKCDYNGEVELSTDDWKHNAYGNCPKCDGDIEVDISPDEDGDEPYYINDGE
jgi:hypothetical protein